jgi:hypothetical protein
LLILLAILEKGDVEMELVYFIIIAAFSAVLCQLISKFKPSIEEKATQIIFGVMISLFLMISIAPVNI